MKKSLTIQIPTYQNPQQLYNTIATLLTYTEFPYHIRVINNDGTKEGKEGIERILSGFSKDLVSVVHSGGNLGWMGAHNLVLDRCDTPLVCLLNDDVFFLPGLPLFWRKITQWFNDPSVGAVGPISNFVMGAQNLWASDVHTNSETTLLIGFCVVMRTELLKAIGGLDETLPGGDDLDYSIRIRNEGYRLLIDKTCFLYHIGQQTGHRVKPGYWDSALHQERTNNALIRKHGVEKWHDTLSAKHWKLRLGEGEFFNENVWYSAIAEKHKGEKGLNLGCGSMKIDGVPGLDLAAAGETGMGGRKWDEAKTDIVGDAMDIPFDDGSLDFLFAAHLFEHLIDPVAALKEWARVLKPGGKLYATMPSHNRTDTMVIDCTHVHAFVPESAKNLFESQGWTVTFCEEFDKSIAFGMIAEAPKKPGKVDQ